MNRKQIAEILSRELECVRRHDTPRCNDKDCIHCDLVLDADIIIEAYTEAITLMNNDWHYPSKGELPPRGEQVLCWLWNGNYCLAYKRKGFTFDGVRCWQYIIPPKEEA